MKKNENVLNLLKTAKGQIEAVIKMYEGGRYCIDVSTQVLASIALLKKANVRILEDHLNSCVKEAFIEGNGEEKTKEIVKIIEKLVK